MYMYDNVVVVSVPVIGNIKASIISNGYKSQYMMCYDEICVRLFHL